GKTLSSSIHWLKVSPSRLSALPVTFKVIRGSVVNESMSHPFVSLLLLTGFECTLKNISSNESITAADPQSSYHLEFNSFVSYFDQLIHCLIGESNQDKIFLTVSVLFMFASCCVYLVLLLSLIDPGVLT